MYNSDDDLVVKYYDQAFGITGEAELAWYLHKAQETGSPVLDLACGTGRLALSLAHEGIVVFAIDRSAGMLHQFRAKLKGQPIAIRRLIHISRQGMSDFVVDQHFNLVLCCDAFFHNLTPQAEADCLRQVAAHLSPHGRFVFNLPNPTHEFIRKARLNAGRVFEKRGRFDLADGSGTLLVEQALDANEQEQIISTILRITRFSPQGQVVETGISGWQTRYLFKAKVEDLLEHAGFKVTSLVGDYKGGPVTDTSQLIFEAGLR